MAEDKKSKVPSGKKLFFITAETARGLAGGDHDVQPDPDQFEVVKRKGKTYFRLRSSGPNDNNGGGSSKKPTTSWTPYLRREEDGSWKCAVVPGNLDKLLTKTEGGVTGISEAGLPIEAGDWAYLEATIEEGEVTSIAYKVGEPWDGNPAQAKFEGDSPPKQIKAWFKLAVCVSDGEGLKLARIHAGSISFELSVVGGQIAFAFK